MLQTILNHIDFIWILIGFVCVPRRYIFLFLGFLIVCFVMMRMQIELMEFINYPKGILGLSEISVHLRCMIFYNLAYGGLTAFLMFAKDKERVLILATMGSVFFGIVIFSTIAMMV